MGHRRADDAFADYCVWHVVQPFRLWLIPRECFDGRILPPLPMFLRLVDRFLNPYGTDDWVHAAVIPYGFPPGYVPNFERCRKLFEQRLRTFTKAGCFESWDKWLRFIRPVERETNLLTYLRRDAADKALDNESGSTHTHDGVTDLTSMANALTLRD